MLKFRRLWPLLAMLAACLLALAACGSSQHSATTTTQTTAPAAPACPPNQSQLGCALRTRPLPGVSPKLAPLPGAEFPDVSVWQGVVDWPSVAAWQNRHGWKAAAIFKLGEYTLDSQAVRNSAQTASLGFWRAGYWFVRNTGCQHEATLLVWAAQRFGLRVVVLDMEVPEAAGYAPCLTAAAKAAGLIPVIYSAPGTWPGGSNAGDSVWVAAYGPAHPPCLFVCTVGVLGRQAILAWQFTDGQFGFPTVIPGIGQDDVSVDFGLEQLGIPAKPKPRPKPEPASRWASAEIQLRSLTGSCQARVRRGRWTVSKGCRVRSLPYDAKPLGGGR